MINIEVSPRQIAEAMEGDPASFVRVLNHIANFSLIDPDQVRYMLSGKEVAFLMKCLGK